jgi:hypothetical protein
MGHFEKVTSKIYGNFFHQKIHGLWLTRTVWRVRRDAKMIDEKYQTPLLLFASAFAMTLATSVIVTSTCNHNVTADIMEARPLDEYGTCRMTVRYVAGFHEIETSQIMECFDVPTSSTVGVCYRHWDHGDFFTYGVPYVPFVWVAAMIVASWALWVATCFSFVHASRHKAPYVLDKQI